LAPRLIAEIGNSRRFYSGKALIAYAGIDALPYESGQFLKLISQKTVLYINFIEKKEQEGKPKKVAKIARLKKFINIKPRLIIKDR